jgi:hypothetical protein
VGRQGSLGGGSFCYKKNYVFILSKETDKENDRFVRQKMTRVNLSPEWQSEEMTRFLFPDGGQRPYTCFLFSKMADGDNVTYFLAFQDGAQRQ